MKAIQDNDWLYNLLSPLVQFGCRCHYRHFVVQGVEHLPTDGPYIIAPCHQQALMEPLAVLNFAPKPPVFLARADLFKKPLLRRLLTFLKIMPVYRIRDGKETLDRNREIFDRCREVLLDGYPLCLMAEGRHNNRHALLPLRKGMFRIAGETQQALGDRPLYIVPVGIDFDEYERPYANVVVNIGHPFAVQPFMATWQTNEPLALNQMRDALGEALPPLMVDIRNEEHYDNIFTLCNILNPRLRRREGLRNNAWNRFLVRQKVARRMDALAADKGNRQFGDLMTLTDTLGAQCRRQRINPLLAAGHWRWGTTLAALLALLLPMAAAIAVPTVRRVLLFLLLCYPLPLLPTHLAVRSRVADPQFRSSFNFGIRFFVSILYAVVIGIVMACCRGAWMAGLLDLGPWWGLVAVAVVVAGAACAGTVVTFLRDTLANSRYHWHRIAHRKAVQQIDRTLETISQTFEKEYNL